jgi:hypothetical protein
MWINTVAIHTVLNNYKVKFSINQLNMKKKNYKDNSEKKNKKMIKKTMWRNTVTIHNV